MSDARKIILRTLLASLAFAALAGVMAALTANDIVTRAMGTGLVTGGAALLMLPLSSMVDRAKLRPAGLWFLPAVYRQSRYGDETAGRPPCRRRQYSPCRYRFREYLYRWPRTVRTDSGGIISVGKQRRKDE